MHRTFVSGTSWESTTAQPQEQNTAPRTLKYKEDVCGSWREARLALAGRARRDTHCCSPAGPPGNNSLSVLLRARDTRCVPWLPVPVAHNHARRLLPAAKGRRWGVRKWQPSRARVHVCVVHTQQSTTSLAHPGRAAAGEAHLETSHGGSGTNRFGGGACVCKTRGGAPNSRLRHQRVYSTDLQRCTRNDAHHSAGSQGRVKLKELETILNEEEELEKER